MSKKSIFALLAVAFALAGCKDKTFNPNAVIRSIAPEFVAQNRTLDVTVEGDFTNFSVDNVTADTLFFNAPGTTGANDGITVNAITVANEEYIQVSISASPTATVGPRDLEINGELFSGVFEVRPPFEVAKSNILAQGAVFDVAINGHGTDWVGGFTEYDFGDDMVTEGVALAGFAPLSTTIIREDLIRVVGLVAPDAAPGAAPVTISSVSFTDTASALFDVVDNTTAVAANATESFTLNQGELAVATEQVPVGNVTDLIADASEIGLLSIYDLDRSRFEPQAIFFYGAAVGFTALREDYGFGNTKGLTVVVSDPWDSYPDVVAFDDLFFGPRPQGYPTTHTIDLTQITHVPTALVSGTAVTGETLTLAGLANWYSFSGTPFNTNTIDLTAVGIDLDGFILTAREDKIVPVLGTDGGGIGANETQLFATGARPLALIGIGDINGVVGATTEYDILLTENTTPGMAFTTANTNLSVVNGTATATFTVNTGLATITDIHFGLDVITADPSDLRVSVTSPGGTTVVLYECLDTFFGCGPGNPFGGFEGIVDVYSSAGAGTAPVSNFGGSDPSDFVTEAPDGTWTWTIEDFGFDENGQTFVDGRVFVEGI